MRQVPGLVRFRRAISRVSEAFNLQRIVDDLAIAEADIQHIRIRTVGHVLNLERVLLGGYQLLKD